MSFFKLLKIVFTASSDKGFDAERREGDATSEAVRRMAQEETHPVPGCSVSQKLAV
jgi:hypothetical protein